MRVSFQTTKCHVISENGNGISENGNGISENGNGISEIQFIT